MANTQLSKKTWWGRRWIEALEKIDSDTNRLPRGRSYANNDRVKEILFHKSNITAKVKGRLYSPYSIKIHLSQFSQEKKNEIIKIIQENPFLLSKLSLGEMPTDLLSLLEEANIEIFPESWEELKSNCSCPDWANPCKHIAAVYYIIGNEIEKNPFLLFSLRGLTKEELSGVADEQNIEQQVELKDYLLPLKKAKIEQIPNQFEHSLDFSSYDMNSLFSILPENQSFYPKADLRKFLKQSYHEAAISLENRTIADEPPDFLRGTRFHLVFSGESFESLHIFVSPFEAVPFILPDTKAKPTKKLLPIWDLYENSTKTEVLEGHFFSLDEILNFFLKYPTVFNLNSATQSARFMSVIAATALSFITSGAFVPKMIRRRDNEFFLLYQPVLHDEQTKKAIKVLEDIYPFWMGTTENGTELLHRSSMKEILSRCITSIFQTSIQENKKYQENKILSTFFMRDTVYVPENFQESNTSYSVENWLEHLSTINEDIVPLISIDKVTKTKFALDIWVENKNQLQDPVRFSEVLNQNKKCFNKPINYIRTKISRQLTIASERLEVLRDYLNNPHSSLPKIDLKTISSILLEHYSFFELIGIRFRLPKELTEAIKPKLTLKSQSPKTISYLSLNSILNFSWEVSIGDIQLTLEQFQKLVKGSEGVLYYKNKYILLNPNEINHLLKQINKPPVFQSPLDVIYSVLSGEFNGASFIPDEKLSNYINNMFQAEDISLPENMVASLRPYQKRGYEWMYSNLQKGLGCCIADDMGLGKTLQVICVLQKMKNEGLLKKQALVVCPTTLLGNWEREVQKFAPDLKTSIFHGTEKSLNKKVDIIFTTYSLVRLHNKNFLSKTWAVLVIDEAQNIKNPLTEQSKSLKNIKADHKIAISGTPVENRLTELWSIYDFINRGYLGDLKTFKKSFATPIERYRNKELIERLIKVTSPFILRRLKTDKSIISDLPDKIVSDEYCYLTKEQAAIYENVVKTTMKSIEKTASSERNGIIFQLMTRLKQVCNHPYHFSKRGSIDVNLSGKSEKTFDILEKILASNQKILIFTQYKEMGELLEKQIDHKFQEKSLFFHGTLTRKTREKMIKDFSDDNGPSIFIISLKAGGTGLNLVNASNVLHYDLWWNPAVENQATDRAYRIGQKKNVYVHRMITVGTFEEKINAMINSKKELADLTVSVGENWITKMSNKELKELFTLNQ
jgi:SNF2 family DNA or RNA helicase/uncharacterized Zn finger protein